MHKHAITYDKEICSAAIYGRSRPPAAVLILQIQCPKTIVVVAWIYIRKRIPTKHRWSRRRSGEDNLVSYHNRQGQRRHSICLDYMHYRWKLWRPRNYHLLPGSTRFHHSTECVLNIHTKADTDGKRWNWGSLHNILMFVIIIVALCSNLLFSISNICRDIWQKLKIYQLK